MNEIRRFTNTDWYAYGGAEKFKRFDPDPQEYEPFIYEREMNEGIVTLTIVANKNGIQLMLSCEEEGTGVWSKEVENFTPLRAEGEMRAITKYIEENFTYAPDLAYELDHSWNKDDVFYGFEYLGDF